MGMMEKEIRGITMRNVIILLVLGLLLTGCSQMTTRMDSPLSFGSFGSGSEKNAGLEQENYQFSGPQKGVVVNFRKGAPNDPISGRFRVIADIANYMDNFASLELDVYDSGSLEGFNYLDAVPKEIGPAIIDDEGKFFKPSTQIVDMGEFIYSNVDDSSEIYFTSKVRYSMQNAAEVTFCVTDTFGESSTNCPESQSLSGGNLGESNSRAPVTVRSVKKTHGGGDGSATLNLDIQISDVGGGRIIDLFEEGEIYNNFVEFSIGSLEGLSNKFYCDSEESVDRSGRHDSEETIFPMKIKLEKGRSANVFCSTNADVNSAINNVRAEISLDYRYEYETKTDVIKVISGISRASLA
ncbi:hypothetical protein HOF78_00475 [Candidatus Woesearchaeota archaeon]|jgi:hypothetical protein|nr:hypothetical protein [Candidatus Woesearchaeota archaeon]MBT6044559.1 hypothetical protein [Candidatus Woesearchaeota archaeon]